MSPIASSAAGTDVTAPYDTLTLVLTEDVALDQAFPLVVNLGTPGVQAATLSDPSIHFTYALGSTAAELDDSPLDAVIVTVTAKPTVEGDPLSATLELFFQDGRVLAAPFSAPVHTTPRPCMAKVLPSENVP